jgi:tetratricopeptide (TPR) repeat protein
MKIPETAQKGFKLAKKEIEKRLYEEARLILNKTLKLYPNYAEAMSLLGYVHYMLKFKYLSKKDVFELSKKALSLNDQSPIVWHYMGNAYSFLNKFDKAIYCYNNAKNLGLKDAKLWNSIGIAYLKSENFEKALFYFNKALMKNPYFIEALNNIGYYFSMIKDYQTANHFFDKAIKLNPYFSAPWSNKGNIYSKLKDFEIALKIYLKGLKLNPDDAHLLNNVGASFYSKKDYDKAIGYLKQAIDADPLYGDPWVNMGTIHSERKNYYEAIKCYEKAINLNPRLFKAWYNKGNVHLKRNEFENAISSFEKTLDLNPDYASAWNNLGGAYFANNNLKEAKNCFEKAINFNPNPTIEWFNLGNLYYSEGNFREAIKSYQKSLELNPDHEGAWFNQGISYLMINYFDFAIICSLEAININPDNFAIYGNLGIAYEGKKQYNKALESFHKVLQLNPNDSLALTSIGHIFFQKGDFNQAISYFKKALQFNPSYIIYPKNREIAYYATGLDDYTIIHGRAGHIINYNSDIWVFLGLAYNQIGNFAEVKKSFAKAIDLNPEDFITHANLGIIFLNEFEYIKSQKYFDLAIDITKKKGLLRELEKITKFKHIIERTAELKPKLDIADNKIDELIHTQDFKKSLELVSDIKNLLKEVLDDVDISLLYSINKDILLAKYHIFECLADCINFNQIKYQKIDMAKEIFASKTEFIKFFYSLQNVKDIINLFKGYSKIEEIPKENEEIIVKSFKTLDFLGFELSKLITGSFNPEYKLTISFPSEKKQIIHPRAIDFQILNEVLEIDYKKEIESKRKLSTIFVENVCEELTIQIPEYKNKKLEKSDFIEFISKFPEELQVSIAKILKKITYITMKEMQESLISLIKNIVEDLKYACIILFEGGRQKSQDPWVYFTKKFSGENVICIKINELPEILSNLEDEQNYYFIFLDDVILTGTQFVDFFNDELKNYITNLEIISNSNKYIQFYLIAGVGSFDSRRCISQKIGLFNEDRIRYGITVGEKNKAFSEKNWDDKDLKEKLMQFLKEKDPYWWNGFKDSQYLIVLEWNTPDNTIGCLWNNTADWKAIFPRN